MWINESKYDDILEKIREKNKSFYELREQFSDLKSDTWDMRDRINSLESFKRSTLSNIKLKECVKLKGSNVIINKYRGGCNPSDGIELIGRLLDIHVDSNGYLKAHVSGKGCVDVFTIGLLNE